MPLQPGQQLAHYRLTEQIGEGGMGVVWQGEDTKLDRSVAIKVLPELFASDPERLARFEREAKLLAALNHPNIGAIHGLEEDDGVRFLVLELVGGETLGERLKRGPLSTDEALDICRQIAEALGAAHEQGILHRDLKPANIKITDEGKVKVLDFGLAKAVEPTASDTSRTASPTLTTGGTAAGVIMGTASYMAPEQARGKAVDKRVDVWAFGCLLYECLTARQVFAGETVTDILGAILHREPEWNALPTGLPSSIPRLLRRCLQRDARQRLHDIADARIILEEARAERSLVGASAPGLAGRRGPGTLALAVGGILLAAAGVLLGRSLAPAEPVAEEIRFTLSHAPLPVDAAGGSEVVRRVEHAPRDLEQLLGQQRDQQPSFSHFVPPLAFSPDGKRLVYAVLDPDGVRRLYLREMDELEAAPIRGSEGAIGPFFSPDGEGIGFVASGELRTIRASGGTPRTLASIGNFKGGAWTADDQILFAPTADAGIFRIPADGGEPELLTMPDPERGERTHRWPQELPGGVGFLVTVGTSSITTFDDANIAVWSTEAGALHTVVEGGMCGRYLSTGHLLFARDNTLLKVPFDLERLEVTGRPEVIAENVVTDPLTGSASFALSREGSLAYVRGVKVEEYQIWTLGLDGTAERLGQETDYFADLDVSPDGRYLALEVDGANSDIWIYDLERRSRSRLTFEWNNLNPLWTPDGRHISYTRGRSGTGDLFWTLADGSGQPEELLAGEYLKLPESWSPDGKVLAYDQVMPQTGWDIWLLDMEERSSRVFLQTPFAERYAMFSPDGNWISYISDETGRPELFVRPYPGPGGKWQISIDGAEAGEWTPDGRSLLFATDQEIYRVSVDTTSGFRVGRPERLFATELSIRSGDLRHDGNGWFLVVVPDTPKPPTEVQVLANWAPASEGS
jgi:Tol biopolymer transport system component